MKQNNIELVVVFKKDIDEQYAQTTMDQTQYPYRKGMDSSRGKLYFYSTGPKFIVTFTTEQEQQSTRAVLKSLPHIHEVYAPDWEKCKD